MITYNDMMEAQNALVADWGEAGKKVVLACWVNRHSMPMKEFLTYCTCCGGNWGGMLLTGIKALSKEVYDAIPDDMGTRPFVDICYTLMLMGIDDSN